MVLAKINLAIIIIINYASSVSWMPAYLYLILS